MFNCGFLCLGHSRPSGRVYWLHEFKLESNGDSLTGWNWVWRKHFWNICYMRGSSRCPWVFMEGKQGPDLRDRDCAARRQGTSGQGSCQVRMEHTDVWWAVGKSMAGCVFLPCHTCSVHAPGSLRMSTGCLVSMHTHAEADIEVRSNGRPQKKGLEQAPHSSLKCQIVNVWGFAGQSWVSTGGDSM